MWDGVGYISTTHDCGTDFLALILTTPLLNEQVHVSQVLTDTVWVSTWLINLVDSEYHWYTGSLRMSDSLLGSWHHRVIGCDDDDGDIGSLGTTGTHGGKRLVTRSIKEGYLTTTLQCHTVSTDVLGNTTRLTGNHIGIADIVEQRGLKDFEAQENGAVYLSENARKTFLQGWQEKKREEIRHPYLEEKLSWGMVPYAQALLLARYLRGDLDDYPPFLWK